MSTSPAPAWFNRLPPFGPRPGTRVVIVDNQVLSYRLLDQRSTPDYDFLFEDPRIVLQIGRRVIQETLRSVGVDDTGIEPDARGRPQRVGPVIHRPGLPLHLHTMMWAGQARLQDEGKLILLGAMFPAQAIVYDRLLRTIEVACGRRVGGKDASVLADALVRGIPLYTDDGNCRTAFLRATTAEPALAAELRALNLTQFASNLFVP